MTVLSSETEISGTAFQSQEILKDTKTENNKFENKALQSCCESVNIVIEKR
jgi:hypothetical protein